MKVWIENKVNNVKEINEDDLIKEFIAQRDFEVPVERDLMCFLSKKRIDNTWFVVDTKDFKLLIEKYFKMKK
jgi:hypothetical protein